AYELIPNSLVLYNIGLVYSAMGRPVEAVDALDKVLATESALAGDRLARAKQTRDDQAARIAKVSVVTNVPAAIEVDNVEVGHSPQAAPLRVAGGVHVVGAVASGYVPMRKEVTVAGGATAEVKLDLVEMQGRVAHAMVKTHLPGADVVIDGQVVGKTPLPSSLTVAPGAHAVELRRAGYVTAKDTLQLGDGAEGEVTLEPEEDRAALGTLGGVLAISASETEPVLTVDGKPRGVATADGVRLVVGPHHLTIERGGFLPVERDVTIDAGRTTSIRVVFDPTPETRAAYLGKISSQRTWGVITGLAGLALAGGSVGFLVWNGRQRTDAEGDLATAEFNIQHHTPPKSVCDTVSQPGDRAACSQIALDAQSNINDADTRDVFGWIGVGVGAAATVLGAVLLVTNGSSHRFDHDRTQGSKGYVLPTGWSDGRGGGGFGVVGAF
ncbi:MAG TPA: PEGA domain-containing protein, partial [Polyangiaceae bacterium]|nr:PEGA domain-containing protein [Polyangiaceae bacterium]